MEEFETVYAALNTAQKRAVDAIDGPVLVVAGPGTGKTQLLSARVAQILRTTDTLPQNILCLTFTESGAQNMRDRLTRFIGKAAYDVQIGTYHAFGGDLDDRPVLGIVTLHSGVVRGRGCARRADKRQEHDADPGHSLTVAEATNSVARDGE